MTVSTIPLNMRDSSKSYLSKGSYSGDVYESHGPAAVTVHSSPWLLSCDSVHCVRCLVWPPQADDWPTRHRKYGWPDTATVDRVVSNGCDVVGAVHRQCRQHEWMDDCQWRLSFSRAEISLINSWMPVQQIVYHMLRVFIKTERLTDSADNFEAKPLSNYHIKTLMLWACERKSRSWWTDDSTLVSICVQLLHSLGGRLTEAQCRHYFISNCNLIDNPCNVANVGGQLMSVDATWLSKWFVDKYIRKCSELCPDNVSRLLDDASTSSKLRNAVSAVVAWRLHNTQVELWDAFESVNHLIPSTVYRYSLSARSCVRWLTELAKIDSCLSVYFTAVAFLHIAHRSSRHGLNDNLMDTLATLFGQVVHRRYYSNTSTSLLSLDRAAKLMKVVANKSLSTMSLTAIELSKAYLYRALRCKDCDSDSICCLANVYLAVLHYTTGQCQTAIDHCTLVMRSQDHLQCSSHVVQGELLPKIDDGIDNVLGLAVFYQHVRTAALNQKCQTQSVSVYTTELFAYYLHLKCLSVAVCMQQTLDLLTDEFRDYESRISATEQPFISDVLLFVLSCRLLKHHKPSWQQSHQLVLNPAEHTTSILVECLQNSAVEHLEAYRQMEARDFGSVVTIVTTDFEALYTYKRGDYQRCLQLSTQNVRTLLCALCLTDIPTFPEFAQLLDDDIVSLTALTLLANPKCRDAVRYVCITQLTLSLYLMTQCQLKLRHPVTSLAQTFYYTKVAQRRHPIDWTLDRLVLRMIARKILTYITS